MYLEHPSLNCPVENSNELQCYLSLCALRRAPSGNVNFVVVVVFVAVVAVAHTVGFP